MKKPGGSTPSHASQSRRAKPVKKDAGVLPQGEARFQAIFDSVMTGICIFADEGHFLTVNDAFCRMVGYTREELTGKSVDEITHPADIELGKKWAGALKTGEAVPRSLEKRYLHKDGHTVWGHISATLIGGAPGHPAHFVTEVRDITGHRKAEAELSASKKQLEEAARIAGLGFWDWNAITDEVHWSEETYRHLGLSPGQLGTNGNALLNYVYHEDVKLVQEHWTKAIEEHTRFRLDFRIRRADGEIRWLHAEADVIRDATGAVTHVMGTELDVTSHKLADERLRLSEERYRAITQAIAESIIVIGPELKVIWANNVAIQECGLSLEEMAGRHCFEVTHQRDGMCDDLDQCPLHSLRSSGEPAAAEHVHVDNLGRKRFVEVTAYPVKDADGKLTQYIHVSRDITERKLVQEKTQEAEILKEYDRLRADLISNVSHELRTPLASIQGFASTLLQTDVQWSEEERGDFLQTIVQESERLASLISDLLDTSRLESGRLTLHRERTSLKEIVDNIKGRLEQLTRKHGLDVVIPDGLPPVLVDFSRVEQVIANLVENAAKFSAPGKRIAIEGREEGDSVIVSVRDEGVGITPAAMSRLFDRFYQVQDAVQGKSKGSGLGLYISRGIIEAHGGRIWVESQSGEGSTFSFSLPLARKTAQGS